MFRKKEITLIALFFSFFLVFAIPPDPNVFYGTVTLNSVPVNGVLELYVNDVFQDKIDVVDGKFGGEWVFEDKLTATGQDGDTIKFVLVVDNYQITPITQIYEEGKVENITLNFQGTRIYPTGSSKSEEETATESPQVNETTEVNQTTEVNESEGTQPTIEQQPESTEELPEEDLEEVIDKLSEFLENYNFPKEPTDVEVEKVNEKTNVLEVDESFVDKIKPVVDEQILSKLEDNIKRGIKPKIQTHSRQLVIKDKKTGESLHALEIRSRVEVNNIENIENIDWIENIPKSIASDVSRIIFETQPTEIINPDPVVRFQIPYKEGQTTYEIQYTAVSDTEVNVEEVNNIVHVVLVEPALESPQEQPTDKTTENISNVSVEEEQPEEQEVIESETLPEQPKKFNYFLILAILVIVVIVIILIVIISKKKTIIK